MTLQETIKAKTKDAMIAKQAERVQALRSMTAAFQSEAIAKKVDTLDEDQTIAIIKRLAKQRKDSIDQFAKGGRQDLVDAEKSELAVLEEFLPASMPREQVLEIAKKKKAELNVTDKAKLGQLMGAVIKESKGTADGAMVKEVVESLFA